MANRKTKPTSPGRRFATYPMREQLTASEPERKLTEGLRKSGGRNANGRVTARPPGRARADASSSAAAALGHRRDRKTDARSRGRGPLDGS